MFTRKSFIVVLFIFVIHACISPNPPVIPPTTNEAVIEDCRLEQLKAIPKLNTIHAGFPVFPDLNDPILDEVIRITGCVPTGMIYDKWPGLIENAKVLADRHNVPIVLNISPMHWFNEPEHIEQVKDLSTYMNPAVEREFQEMISRCKSIKQKLCGRLPTMALLDCERYNAYGRPPNEVENLRKRYTRMYRIVKKIFGRDIKIWWFGFTPRHINNGDRWNYESLWNHGVGEPTEGTSCAHYHPQSLLDLYENVYHTTNWPGFENLPTSVWISLGAKHLRPNSDDVNPNLWSDTRTFIYDADYEYYYSWWAGRIINLPNYHGDRYTEALNKIELVCFWPPAMDHRVPKWLDHFIAYCHGAQGKWQEWTSCVNQEN